MNKYIRTKDGIFKVVDILTDGRIKVRTFPNLKRFTRVHEAKDIIKQADTIEELCDEYIVYHKSREFPIIGRMSNKEDFYSMKEAIMRGLRTNCNCWLKLGIWTDKGLIYVAKLKEDGMLELI